MQLWAGVPFHICLQCPTHYITVTRSMYMYVQEHDSENSELRTYINVRVRVVGALGVQAQVTCMSACVMYSCKVQLCMGTCIMSYYKALTCMSTHVIYPCNVCAFLYNVLMQNPSTPIPHHRRTCPRTYPATCLPPTLVPTYPRAPVPTYPRSPVPTYPRTHVPPFPRTLVPTYPRPSEPP